MSMPESTGAVRAPEIDREGMDWLNVDRPLSLERLAGKLVILDFWTASCVDCLHVLDTLSRIEAAFPNEAAVIGVHSPKFPAERELATVRRAVARLGITHPVAHDPDLQLWQEYAVSAWPTLVFVSPDGKVLGQVSGEPDRERLITAIAELVETWESQGVLRPRPLALRPEQETGGRFRFPAKLKAVPGQTRRWVLADAGHHQVALLDDGGAELARFGAGDPGFRDGRGDDVAFRSPQGLAADTEAVFVADTGNHAVRRVDLASGEVITLAGTGERGSVLEDEEPALATALASPWDLEVEAGRVYVANAGTHQLALLEPAARRLSRLAGNGMEDIIDGPAAEAQLAQPSGLALDGRAAVLYFTDAETSAVRALALEDEPRVATLVGQGLFDFGHLNGPLEAGLLQRPLGLAVWDGRILVADSYNACIRILDPQAGRIDDLDDGFACTDETCVPVAEPTGAAADGAERVLVVDRGSHRVLDVRPRERTFRTWAG